MKEIIIGSGLILIFSLLAFTPFIKVLDLRAVDLFLSSHPSHPEVVILAVDNKSLKEIGRWPWSRSIPARLLRILDQAGVRAAGLDINFSESSSTQDDQFLAEALAEVSFPLVLPVEIISYQDGSRGLVRPLASFSNLSNVFLGHVNVPTAPDGLARPFPEELALDSDSFQPFAIQLAQAVGAALPAADNLVINFAGPAGAFATFSVSDVISGRLDQAVLKDKIILVGATASDLHDLVSVPGRGLMAGVEWQANVLDNILLRRPRRAAANPAAWLLGLILAAGLYLYSLKTKISRSLLAALILGLLLPAVSFLAFRSDFVLPYFFNMVLLAGVFSGQGIYRWYKTDLEKKKLRRTIDNYFSPSVLEAILANPAGLQLGGERREITVLFSDIRSFTAISETLAPEKLSQLLHQYFTEMTEEILATDGVVDKFIGDAIMAFWGAPIAQSDHPRRAVAAAVGMMRRLRRLQDQWLERGWPKIDIGIGIHTGSATVGNMGSAKRFDYTVIGDTVNAASRLESLNKDFQTNIIISEETARRLEGIFLTRPLGEVKVKGKTRPLKIYEVVVV